MTAEGETKVTVGSMSLMRRGELEEGWGLYEEGPRERDEEELEYGVGSGKMSMKTGVRDSEGLFLLEGGMIGEPVDEEEDEWSLVEESPDK